jgi:hypothetical protein
MKVDSNPDGNSRGVRIPKPVRETAAGREIRQSRASLRRKPRQGWEEAFIAATGEPDELLLHRAPPNRFDAREWRW